MAAPWKMILESGDGSIDARSPQADRVELAVIARQAGPVRLSPDEARRLGRALLKAAAGDGIGGGKPLDHGDEMTDAERFREELGF